MRSTALNSLLTPIYTIWLSILLTAGQPVWANDCPEIQPLQKYSIHQIFFTHGSDFDILDGQRKVGKIVQKMLSWGKTFELLNERGQLVAKARQEVFSLGVKVNVFDCHERIAGSLQENILKSLFKTQTVYSLIDGQGQLLGQSKKLDFFGTDISFYSASEQLYASLSRPYINWVTDKWVLTVNGQSALQSVLFFTAAYKTSVDSERKSESSSSSSKK